MISSLEVRRTEGTIELYHGPMSKGLDPASHSSLCQRTAEHCVLKNCPH